MKTNSVAPDYSEVLEFLDFANPGSIFDVDLMARDLAQMARRIRESHDIPLGKPEGGLTVIIIDYQVCFCSPNGALYVAGKPRSVTGKNYGDGALADTARAARWIIENAHLIDKIVVTRDYHTLWQIFMINFLQFRKAWDWTTPDGDVIVSCKPGDMIPDNFPMPSLDMWDQGIIELNPDVVNALGLGPQAYGALRSYVRHYIGHVTGKTQFDHVTWTPHALGGGMGQMLMPLLHAAIIFHGYLRGVRHEDIAKADIPLSEMFSPVMPIVMDDPSGQQIHDMNTALINEIVAAKKVVTFGQASSNCFKSFVDDALSVIAPQDQGMVDKMSILRDLCSPVVIDGVLDLWDLAEEAFDSWEDAGLTITDTVENAWR